MKQKTRYGELTDVVSAHEKLLAMLYGHLWGRLLLKPLTQPKLSEFVGRFLSSGASRFLIKPFIKHNHIDMSLYEDGPYYSYNEFFSRKIRPDVRYFDMDPSHLVSPCDGKLTAMPITDDCRFTLKHTVYTVESLLQNRHIAREYDGGYVLIFRLTVDDYHRYCYIADGRKTQNIRIRGVLHTVNPIANDVYPIYKENSREYTILNTKEFGDVVIMEVGALLVGRIINYHGNQFVRRGQEKGCFEYGGSTIVLLVKKDTVILDDDIMENSAEHIETVVKMGEKIGYAI
ncbi:MAG: phosphatidylserine decarboxylase [Firmicutes bacterium]|nr:phosphatidylserine decarboxylase [Bacillota bacterium]